MYSDNLLEILFLMVSEDLKCQFTIEFTKFWVIVKFC